MIAINESGTRKTQIGHNLCHRSFPRRSDLYCQKLCKLVAKDDPTLELYDFVEPDADPDRHLVLQTLNRSTVSDDEHLPPLNRTYGAHLHLIALEQANLVNQSGAAQFRFEAIAKNVLKALLVVVIPVLLRFIGAAHVDHDV